MTTRAKKGLGTVIAEVVDGQVSVSLVTMVRDAEQFPASHTADVHPDEVENYKAGGWQVK